MHSWIFQDGALASCGVRHNFCSTTFRHFEPYPAELAAHLRFVYGLPLLRLFAGPCAPGSSGLAFPGTLCKVGFAGAERPFNGGGARARGAGLTSTEVRNSYGPVLEGIDAECWDKLIMKERFPLRVHVYILQSHI